MRLLRLLQNLDLLAPVLAAIALFVAANALALRYPYRLDLTDTGVYSIGKQTRKVIAALDAPVSVTFFYDVRSKAMMDSRALLEQFDQASTNITARFVDPALQPAVAQHYNVRFAGTSVFESRGRQIRVTGGAEADFTNGLIRASAQSLQTICFTDGHIESDPFSLKTHDHFEGAMTSPHHHSTGGRALEVHERHGMGRAKDALGTLGYTVRKVRLLMGPGQLEGCSVVVVASPQQAFEPRESDQLSQYLAGGGRAFFMLEPHVDSGLGGLLAQFGVALEPGTVFDESRHYWTDSASPAVSDYPRHKITRNLALTFYPGAASLVPAAGGARQDIKVIRLVTTSKNARIAKAGGKGPQGQKDVRTLAVEVFKKNKPQEGRASRPAHIVVVGDGDFATNSYYHLLGNGALFLNAVSALAGEERLIDIEPRGYVLPTIRLTNNQMLATFVLSSLLLPGLLLVSGAVVWWRRR